MKKILIILILFVSGLSKSYAQSGDLEIVGVDPAIATIGLNTNGELILVVNQNGPGDLPVGSARVNISINPSILNWVLPVTLTDDCGGLWAVQTANPTATTPQIQIRNSSVLPNNAGCIIRLQVKGIAIGTGSVNVSSTVFGPGVSDPNGINQGADTQVTVTAAPPVTTNDVASGLTRTTAVSIAVLSNDTPGSSAIDVTSVRLVDPVGGGETTSVTIPGEGTYTVNPATGVVSFMPLAGFMGQPTPVQYTIKDINSLVSNVSTITITLPLPVTLVSFNVVKEGKAAVLNWATTEETNSDHFEVQHSVTGKGWQNVGTVASSGESKSRKVYSFTHRAPVDGENLYRLKMIDKDQTFAYSRIQGVKFEGIGTDLSVYPNPSADVVYVRDVENVEKVVVMDMKGNAVYQSNGLEKGVINVRNLLAGPYAVKIVRKNGNTTVQKIVVIK